MLMKPQVFYDDTHKQALGYQNPFYLKKAQRIKPILYDGSVISRKHDVIYVVDEEETLILEEEIRSEMLAKQKDLISKEKKINISPINYYELNKLAEDLKNVLMEAPSELPKVSMVKTSFQKLKNHLASFDKVVKVRTTHDAITKGSWDFNNGLHIEINEVKMVFNQIEVVVEQCSVDKKYFDIQKKEIFLDNDRLLEHIICQDVMNILMHADYVTVNVLPANNKCLVHDNLKIKRLEQENEHLFELLLSQDIVHICVNSLATRNECCEMQQSFIHEYNENLVLKAEIAKKEHMIEKKFFDEVVLRYAPEIQEFFNINEWQVKLNAKDVSIANLRKHIKSLKGKNVIEKDATPYKA
ncbi:hypothetical protein Tco_0441133 [Tanacetum coccineum]